MARSYSRDSKGRFGISQSRKDTKAAQKRTQRDEKAKLSGGHLGGKSGARGTTNRKLGKGASLKSVQKALANARKRFT